jgi:hypothetical protein
MYRMLLLQNAVYQRGAFCRDRVCRDRQRIRFIPGKESKRLRIVVVSDNREIQIELDYHTQYYADLQNQLINSRPLSIALVINAARMRPFKKASTNSILDKRRRTQAILPRHVAIGEVAECPSRAAYGSGLVAGRRVGQGAAPTAGAVRGDFGVGRQ